MVLPPVARPAQQRLVGLEREQQPVRVVVALAGVDDRHRHRDDVVGGVGGHEVSPAYSGRGWDGPDEDQQAQGHAAQGDGRDEPAGAGQQPFGQHHGADRDHHRHRADADGEGEQHERPAAADAGQPEAPADRADLDGGRACPAPRGQGDAAGAAAGGQAGPLGRGELVEPGGDGGQSRQDLAPVGAGRPARAAGRRAGNPGPRAATPRGTPPRRRRRAPPRARRRATSRRIVCSSGSAGGSIMAMIMSAQPVTGDPARRRSTRGRARQATAAPARPLPPGSPRRPAGPRCSSGAAPGGGRSRSFAVAPSRRRRPRPGPSGAVGERAGHPRAPDDVDEPAGQRRHGDLQVVAAQAGRRPARPQACRTPSTARCSAATAGWPPSSEKIRGAPATSTASATGASGGSRTLTARPGRRPPSR